MEKNAKGTGQPLLERTETRESPGQKAITQTLRSAAHLAKLLPTGTVLAFQLLAPICTNRGSCDATSAAITAALVVSCGVSCFVLSFSDTFRDEHGAVRHGMATLRGLWVIDGAVQLPPETAATYRIRFVDFLHAFMSVLVFVVVALFDHHVVSCFYPVPSPRAEEMLTSIPVGIGVLCSMLFVVFPTARHGIGFPVAPHDA